ncbi:MAG: hypothetical protein AB4352_07775 [Hormoscilla sp.]
MLGLFDDDMRDRGSNFANNSLAIIDNAPFSGPSIYWGSPLPARDRKNLDAVQAIQDSGHVFTVE